MAGKTRHLRQRGTTFFVRMGVPQELRAIVGKSELHESLGCNQREAERRSHAALARFQAILEAHQRGGGALSGYRRLNQTNRYRARHLSRSTHQAAFD